ncbi:MAG TPA: phosphoglycerate mutase family protein [Gaiellaceae bacterium]|jgi:8-oxo-dGTP diphosphatase
MLLIRHARAGERTEWSGDDRRRPLDERGRKQAADLIAALSGRRLTRILSSPYDRCVQTVEPLARGRGLEVEIRDELGEEQQLEQGAELVRSLLGQDVAVCGHGGLSDALAGVSQKKGEALVLDEHGRVVESIRS